MRTALRWLGNLCIVLSVVGLAGMALIIFGPETTPPWVDRAPFQPRPPLAQAGALAASGTPGLTGQASGGGQSARPAGAALAVNADKPITHLNVERIGLSADVVPAHLVEHDGATTWEVPAFKVGHAETTAGAGEPGNAILLGHVTSVHSGNVFADLEQVQVGDIVQIFASAERFDYQVTDVQRVPRTDSDVLEPGTARAVSLITCTGIWLPTIWDYTERLVVRAELADIR